MLSTSLHHYSTLHPQTVTHTLHGSQSQPLHSRLVQFHSLERHFQLYLKPHYRLFSPGFKVHSIDRHGNRRLHEFDRTEYYHGYMEGEESSIVTAHISDSGIMTVSITTPSETYRIEPSYDFITGPHPHHMIAYRGSDIKRDRLSGTKFDYVVAPTLPPGVRKGTTGDHQTLKRQTVRSGGTGKSCSMALIADYRFFKVFGSGAQDLDEAVAGITRRLTTLVSEVDSTIYRGTEWILDPISDTTDAGFGLEIAQVQIHDAPFTDSFRADSSHYYNSDKCCGEVVKEGSSTALDANNLLSAFNFGPWEGYCLAHLFTFVNFPSGLLGLANIASSFRSQTGGICSEGFFDSSQQRDVIYNTGLSSFTSGGIPIIRAEQVLVVGHEVGHNWGSHHDPPHDEDCDKSYLMNEFAQDDSLTSHRMFSVCSRTSIGQVLRRKADCFAEPSGCGDYMIGERTDGTLEKCDEGPTGGDCCTPDCLLRPGKQCSDTNSPCCFGCRVAMAERVCEEAGDFTTNCSINIACDGVNVSCPAMNTSFMAAPGTLCLLGRCSPIGNNLTKCVDFCKFNGMVRCNCTREGETCKLCCQNENGDCEVSSEDINLPTGTRCKGGACIAGRCRATQDTITRFFNIISNLDVNDFVLFLQENIVGFTLIFSLLLWIPGSISLHCFYDRKVWRKFKMENVDFIRALRLKPEIQPLIDRGELRSRSTSPIDDAPLPPSYYRTYSPVRLSTLREEEEGEEDETDSGPLPNTVTLI
jgi:disintegrin and metalloproteinase domain-containing protein 17